MLICRVFIYSRKNISFCPPINIDFIIIFSSLCHYKNIQQHITFIIIQKKKHRTKINKFLAHLVHRYFSIILFIFYSTLFIIKKKFRTYFSFKQIKCAPHVTLYFMRQLWLCFFFPPSFCSLHLSWIKLCKFMENFRRRRIELIKCLFDNIFLLSWFFAQFY
jgi:hypothetical protein